MYDVYRNSISVFYIRRSWQNYKNFNYRTSIVLLKEKSMVEITPKTVKMQVLADFMQILTSRLDFYSKNLVFYYQCARKCGQTRTNSKSGNLKSKFLRLFWRLCKFLIICILEISFLTTISLNWISFVFS